MTQPDDALTTSREVRERHADRTDVLVRVKALALLPDDTHATKEIVAAYFEVPVATVDSVVEDNRAELESNGFRVLRGADLRAFANPLKGSANLVGPKTRSLALFNRRAILNVAMLLRDSTIARQVRTYLLDAESVGRRPLADIDLNDLHAIALLGQAAERAAMRAIAAEERAVEEALRADKAEARADQLEPAARNWEAVANNDGLTLREFHKTYFSAVTEHAFFEHLYARGYLIDQRGKGTWSTRRQKYRDGSQHRHPGHKGKPFLYLHTSLDRSEIRRKNARVRPGDPEAAFKNQLAKEGLPLNTRLAIEARNA